MFFEVQEMEENSFAHRGGNSFAYMEADFQASPGWITTAKPQKILILTHPEQ